MSLLILLRKPERNLMTTPHSESPQSPRSELLKAEIEFVDEHELIVRTDQNGSVKLRGATNVPMFLALWNAPKHRLPKEKFLDADVRGSQTNFERHRARLCGRLQEVLIEVVDDSGVIRMRTYRP